MNSEIRLCSLSTGIKERILSALPSRHNFLKRKALQSQIYEKGEGAGPAVRASLPVEGVMTSQGEKKAPSRAVRTTENSVTIQQQLSHSLATLKVT